MSKTFLNKKYVRAVPPNTGNFLLKKRVELLLYDIVFSPYLNPDQ